MIKPILGFGIIIPIFVLFSFTMFIQSLFSPTFEVESGKIIFFILGSLLMLYLFIKAVKDILLISRLIKISSNKEVFIFNKSCGKINKVTESKQYSKLGFDFVLNIECEHQEIKISQFYYYNYKAIKRFLTNDLNLEIELINKVS